MSSQPPPQPSPPPSPTTSHPPTSQSPPLQPPSTTRPPRPTRAAALASLHKVTTLYAPAILFPPSGNDPQTSPSARPQPPRQRQSLEPVSDDSSGDEYRDDEEWEGGIRRGAWGKGGRRVRRWGGSGDGVWERRVQRGKRKAEELELDRDDLELVGMEEGRKRKRVGREEGETEKDGGRGAGGDGV